MTTTNISTLKIQTLSKEQYLREQSNGRLDNTSLYLTPDTLAIDEGAGYNAIIANEIASNAADNRNSSAFGDSTTAGYFVKDRTDKEDKE